MNELPDLPRVLKKREAEITPIVERWFLSNHDRTVLIEVKATKNNTIPFKAVKPHQLLALLAVRSKKGMAHKMSDIGMVRQPADFWMMKEADSYVVACFLKERICLAIDPNNWQGATKDSPCEFKIYL